MPVESAHEPPEGALVRLHRRGNEEAFDLLYRGFFPRLVRLCRRWSTDEASAEDLAQETLVRAYVHLSSYDDSRPMWPWLKTIASRLAGGRSARNARELPLGPQDGGAAEDPIRWADERVLLARALTGLNRRHRLAIRLRYLEEWTPSEAASFLGLTAPAFRQLLARARIRLRAEYRRISGGATGLVAVPVGWIRSLGHRTAERFQKGASSSPAASSALSSEALQQFVAGLAALLLLLGGIEGTQGSGKEGDHPGGAELASPRTARASSSEPPQTPAPPAGRNSREGGAGDQEPSEGPTEYAKETVENIKDPNRKVEQPEDAQITSIEFSPSYESDGTVFAAGNAKCKDDLCPSVLFISRNGGGSWERLPAAGFQGEELLLPPAYGDSDFRSYAMGSAGLQVSADGGRTFRSATPGGFSPKGPAAISPAFNLGDPSIVIGDIVLTRFRADMEIVEPASEPSSTGPYHPAYSPTFESDGLLFLGGIQTDLMNGGMGSVVFKCREAECSAAPLPGQSDAPQLLIGEDPDMGRAIYAFTRGALYVSHDGALSFELVRGDWPEGWLRDLEFGADGAELIAAVGPDGKGAQGGLYRSVDAGMTWSELAELGPSPGTGDVEVHGLRILAAAAKTGLVCSADGGKTWSRRC